MQDAKPDPEVSVPTIQDDLMQHVVIDKTDDNWRFRFKQGHNVVLVFILSDFQKRLMFQALLSSCE